MRRPKSRATPARWRPTWRSSGRAWRALPRRSSCERAGRSFVVLEARDRVGGRLESIDIGGGNWVDVGGQWVGPTQDRLYALARAHGAAIFPTWTAGENLVELGGRLTRYTGTIPRLGPHVLADVSQAMLRLDRMASKVPLEAPWDAPKAQRGTARRRGPGCAATWSPGAVAKCSRSR